MTKIRLPVSLKLITCKITETASITNTPPTTIKSSSCFTADRDDADHPADGERSGISHENFGRVTVEPEKAETRADQCGADDGQLSGKRIKRDLQVFRDPEISSRIRKQRVAERHRDGATDREAIEPVGQVDRVR